MADQFVLFPDLPQFTETTTWGDRQVQLRLTFRSRTASWYLDIFELDSTPIVFGRRVSPRFAPLLGLGFGGEQLPRDRELFTDGPTDPYARSDLGEILRLLLLSDEELADAAPEEDLLGISAALVP